MTTIFSFPSQARWSALCSSQNSSDSTTSEPANSCSICFDSLINVEESSASSLKSSRFSFLEHKADSDKEIYHTFHRSCLTQFKQTKNTQLIPCPLCKKEGKIENNQFKELAVAGDEKGLEELLACNKDSSDITVTREKQEALETILQKENLSETDFRMAKALLKDKSFSVSQILNREFRKQNLRRELIKLLLVEGNSSEGGAEAFKSIKNRGFNGLACKGDEDLLKFGLENRLLTDDDRGSVFNSAANKSQIAVIDLLLKDKQVDDYSMQRAFEGAVYSGHLEVVKRLLEVGINQLTDDVLNRAYKKAAKKGFSEIAQVLIDSGKIHQKSLIDSDSDF